MRIGLIGCGSHGQTAVIPAIERFCPAGQLVAAADLDPKGLESIRPPVARYTDYRHLLNMEDLDLVYVAATVQTHYRIVVDALAAGRHVVCEKPMALTTRECREMVETARRAGRRLFVTFETRYHEHFRQIRQWINQGYLGRVGAIHLHQFWDGHKAFGPYAERRARLMEFAGGFDCGIHKIDLVRYFVGGNWARMHADGAWLGENVTFPSHLAILARMDNGVLATVNVSMGYAAQIDPRPMTESLAIVGDKGVVSMAIDEPDPDHFRTTRSVVRLASERLETTIPVDYAPHAAAIGQMLTDIAKVLSGEPVPPQLATGEDGLVAQSAVDEALRQVTSKAQMPPVGRPAIGPPIPHSSPKAQAQCSR